MHAVITPLADGKVSVGFMWGTDMYTVNMRANASKFEVATAMVALSEMLCGTKKFPPMASAKSGFAKAIDEIRDTGDCDIDRDGPPAFAG